MKKHLYTAFLALLSITITSCGNKGKKTITDGEPPIPVKVNTVNSNGGTSFITASGKIQAINSANLSTRIMGFVQKIHVNVGDNVKKGQVLIAINTTDLQAKRAQVNANIAEATVAFNNAEKDYDRYKNLFADHSASQKEMDDMAANYEMAKARLEAANQMKNEVNAQFAYANITAPFNGVVTHKSIKVGDMANPGATLISIEAPTEFEIMAKVPESNISQIKSGAFVTVLVTSISRSIKGKVTEISTSANNTGGQFLVKVVLGETDAHILSGMFATVQFPVDKEDVDSHTLLIPSEAILHRGQLSGVYTISQNNTALLRWLRLGRTYGEQTEVLAGLSADESYIISAEGKLYNGAKILIQ